MDELKTKICTKCGEEKHLDKYYTDKRANDLKTSACKVCIIKKQKEYRENNKDIIQKKRAEYRIKNREKLRKVDNEYYKKCKEREKVDPEFAEHRKKYETGVLRNGNPIIESI